MDARYPNEVDRQEEDRQEEREAREQAPVHPAAVSAERAEDNAEATLSEAPPRPPGEADRTEDRTVPSTRGGEEREPTGEDLLSKEERESLGTSWESIQAGFVDEPRRAVAEAHDLVGRVVEMVTATFARERQHLEALWDRGEDVSTEDLRVALQRYREFFTRLLAA